MRNFDAGHADERADVCSTAPIEASDGDANAVVGAADGGGRFGAGNGDSRHGGDGAGGELASRDFAHGGISYGGREAVFLFVIPCRRDGSKQKYRPRITPITR